MPFYEYVCDGCGEAFEQFARTMTPEAPKCPKCGGAKVTRKMSTFGGSRTESRQPAPDRCGACAQSGSCPMAQ